MRKDVWRLRPGGEVKVQVRFGEFGGAYVNHCHNTTHEDFAMLLRMQVLAAHPDQGGTSPQYVVTKTPIPTPNGVLWKDPGDPSRGRSAHENRGRQFRIRLRRGVDAGADRGEGSNRAPSRRRAAKRLRLLSEPLARTTRTAHPPHEPFGRILRSRHALPGARRGWCAIRVRRDGLCSVLTTEFGGAR